MSTGGIAFLVLLAVIGTALIAGGVMAPQRRRDWLVASMAIVAILG